MERQSMRFFEEVFKMVGQKGMIKLYHIPFLNIRLLLLLLGGQLDQETA